MNFMKRIKGMKNYQKEFISVIVLMLLVWITLAFAFDFANYDMAVPLTYFGTDDFTVYKNAKMLSDENGWIHETERLGAPYGAEYYDFLPDSLVNVDNLFLKFFGMFSDNPVTATNITVIFLFFIIALTTYYALRQFEVRHDIAVMGALCFDFMYYHFYRLTIHFSLSSYEFVPIAIVLCVWVWNDEKFFRFSKGFWRYKKNWLAILFCLLIANNGIAYYPFFACMFLVISGISGMVKKKTWYPLATAGKIIGLIVIFLVTALVPSIVYQMQNGAKLTERLITDSELYAMKIFQLLVPYKGYCEKVKEIITEYYATFTYTEAVGSYLGLVAGIGFLLLLLGVFWNDKTDKMKCFRLFVELNFFAVLFATVGGFSSIFANFVTNLIRGANRISIFIGFISIAAVCVLMSVYLKGKHQKRWTPYVVYGIFVLGICLTLYDQIPSDLNVMRAVFKENQESDKEFIEQIEQQLPERAMIYQLPYHSYPESGAVNEMQDYQLLTGFLYSDTLRWSYGGSRDREGDLWNRSISEMEIKDMIEVLKEKGFSGIYVDKRAYLENEMEFLSTSINVELGYTPQISKNGNLFFWKFES